MRRLGLLIPVLGLLLTAGCSRPPDIFRVGVETNLSCAPVILAFASDSFASEMGMPVRPLYFGAGPAIAESLAKGELEAACVDPVGAVYAALRSKGEFVVVAGLSSGGAALVVDGTSLARSTDDLGSGRVFTPQPGSALDVVARQFFAEQGFIPKGQGGEFQFSSGVSADALSLLRQGFVSAVWTGEPWASDIVEQAKGRILLEQADVWKSWNQGEDPAAVLVIRRSLLQRERALVDRFVEVCFRSVLSLTEGTPEVRQAVQNQLTLVANRTFSPVAMENAWRRIRFSVSIPVEALDWYARAAQRLGYLGNEVPDVSGAIDDTSLRFVLEKGGA